jgi:hypothetical protein
MRPKSHLTQTVAVDPGWEAKIAYEGVDEPVDSITNAPAILVVDPCGDRRIVIG